jgi:hypothetical protein
VLVGLKKPNENRIYQSAITRKIIKRQVMDKFNFFKSQKSDNVQLKYVTDIVSFKTKYVLDLSKLHASTYKPRMVFGDVHLFEFSQMLKRDKLLNGLSHVENNLPHRDLIVLDNPLVEKDYLYQSLMSSKQHKTGKDARATTLVFSSIALLANCCWCEKTPYNIMAINSSNLKAWRSVKVNVR